MRAKTRNIPTTRQGMIDVGGREEEGEAKGEVM